jgi:hypothetical protein
MRLRLLVRIRRLTFDNSMRVMQALLLSVLLKAIPIISGDGFDSFFRISGLTVRFFLGGDLLIRPTLALL